MHARQARGKMMGYRIQDTGYRMDGGARQGKGRGAWQVGSGRDGNGGSTRACRRTELTVCARLGRVSSLQEKLEIRPKRRRLRKRKSRNAGGCVLRIADLRVLEMAGPTARFRYQVSGTGYFVQYVVLCHFLGQDDKCVAGVETTDERAKAERRNGGRQGGLDEDRDERARINTGVISSK